jgi:hypothetical protein
VTLIEFIGPKEVAAADEDRFVGYLARELKAPAAVVYVLSYVEDWWAEGWRRFNEKKPFRVEAE